MTPGEAKSMNVKERLQTMEVLWESLRYDEAEIDSPDWHEDILKERMKKFEKGKMEFISLKDLKRRMPS